MTTNSIPANVRRRDPQSVLTSRLTEREGKTDLLTIDYRLNQFFELVCIANVPSGAYEDDEEESETVSPPSNESEDKKFDPDTSLVYIKFKEPGGDPASRNDPQDTVKARLIDTSVGKALTFSVPLGLFNLHFICNIPHDGETEASVYVHHQVRRNRFG
jgi:hypothetical protein